MEDENSKYVENGVLKNLLNIKDPEDLEKVEREITSFKLFKLFEDPGNQTFDSKHYLSIHKYLFEDIYAFAGKIRDEEISKSIPFCLTQYIYTNLTETLRKSRAIIPKLDTPDKLFEFVLEFYSDLDCIHPFREGNGRTLREYIRQYMEYVCITNNFPDIYFLDYGRITRDEYLDAIIRADAACRYDKLRVAFNKCLKCKPNLEYEEDRENKL